MKIRITTRTKLIAFLFLLTTLNTWAQVGINTADAKATLHVSPVKTDGTTAEGIIAPNLTRSQLIAKDANYGVAQTGTEVYVTTIDGAVSTKTAQVTQVGYYYFDGSIWQAVDTPGQYFYLPVFDLPTAVIGTGKTFDLYQDVYQKQFNQSGNTLYNTSHIPLTTVPHGRYASTDLDYVVTFYDTDVIKINSISAAGVINYDILSNRLGPSSFINVVFITKR